MPFPEYIPSFTYSLPFSVAATAALDVFSLQAPANKVLRIRRIVLVNPGTATAAALVDAALGVATAVGSGGAAGTPQPLDQGGPRSGGTGTPAFKGGATPAFSGVARVGDTVQAAGFVATHNPVDTISVPAAAGAGPAVMQVYPLTDDPTMETVSVYGSLVAVLRIPAVGAGAANLRGYVEFTVSDP